MAIKAADLKTIAALLKVKEEDLTAAIKAEGEVDLSGYNPTGLQVFTTEELSTRDTNVKEASKSEHINAGKEIAIKELKQASGIEFPGKDPAKFLEEFKGKVMKEAKIPTDAKVTELETQITTLKGNLSAAEQKATDAENRASQAALDARILSSLPAERNPALSDADYLLLVKNRIAIETIDGKEVVKSTATGQAFRNQKAEALDLGSALGEVFKATPGWVGGKAQDKNGRGGSGSGGPGGGSGDTNVPTTFSEAKKAWIESGKSPNAAEFSVYVNKLQTENKDFKMDIENVSASGE